MHHAFVLKFEVPFQPAAERALTQRREVGSLPMVAAALPRGGGSYGDGGRRRGGTVRRNE